MGRTLDSLKHAEGGRSATGTAALQQPCQTEPVEPETENGEVIPFIEVGPHRSVEGSADVLASKPTSPGSYLGPRLLTPEPPGPGVVAPVLQTPSASAESAGGPEVGGRVPRTRIFAPGMPGPRFAAELVAYHRPENAVSQQYCRLIEPLLAPTTEERSRVVLFTSVRPGCGTTTVLLNCAITAARHGRKRVVAVDGNLRRPALAERLGLGEVPGLRDVLSGKLPLERAIQETDQADLFALTAGVAPMSAGIRYLAETFRSLLRQLRHRFDLVLVDGPRWDGQPDVVVLGTICDAVYLVVSEQEAESAQVDELYQRIPEAGVCLAGCILA